METTPLDDDGGVKVDSSFMSVVDEVMGSMPGMVRVAALGASGGPDYDVYAAGKVASAGFRGTGGSMGQVRGGRGLMRLGWGWDEVGW